MTDESTSLTEIFGEVIHAYTRAQALEDGVLVDLAAAAPDVCAQHFKYPVACTASVWGLVESACKDQRLCTSPAGVIHDILWMARMSPSARDLDPTTRLFGVIIGRRHHRLKMVCGPGDDAEPVMTVMLPEED
jgi:hypothetical protein